MKKLLSILMCVGVLLMSSACAAEESRIFYERSEEGSYDYRNNTVYLAKDAEGRIIPLSVGPYDGYHYVYCPEGEAFTTHKISYPLEFNDLNEWQRTTLGIREMAARGVLVGYEDGSFRPDKSLTRAEMATVFARLFSVEPEKTKSCFSDVTEDHWAHGYVMALVNEGVFMKDTLFNPNQPVTREQLTAMTYRMLQTMGMIQPRDNPVDLSRYKDMDSVEEYAKEAYRMLLDARYMLLTELVEHDFMDSADDEYYFMPKQPVTRLECADYLYNFVRTFMRENAPAIREADAPQVDIPVLDGSTSTYDITKNIYSFFYRNYDKAPGFPKAHSKTTNAYKRLIDGEVEMIFVPDAGEDVVAYAKEKGVTLKFVPIANEALVFFTGKDNPVNSVTTKDLHDIYVHNAITNWNALGGGDNPLAAFCRNNDSGSHAQMENFILDGEEIHDDISRERISVMMATILTDVEKYNRENSSHFALGYSLYYYYNNVKSVIGPVDLKLLGIDGILPTDETIADGSYPYTTNYYAVVRDGEENPRVDAFLELMQSEFGDTVAQMSGLGVIK